MKKVFLASAIALATGFAQADTVNIICSVQAEWCNMIGTVYGRTTGTKINISMKGSGEALAQLIAEKENPKTDIWFGGTGDPHLQAAEQGLSLEYKSPNLSQLQVWAQQQAAQSKYRTVGIYSGPLGFGYNTELLAKKKMQAPKVWADLLNPALKGEIQVANPASSGTAYTMVATVHPQWHRADQGCGSWRDDGVDQFCARCARRKNEWFSCRGGDSRRRNRCRDRVHEHHQRGSQFGGSQEVLRVGIDPRSARDGGSRQTVSGTFQQGRQGRPPSA